MQIFISCKEFQERERLLISQEGLAQTLEKEGISSIKIIIINHNLKFTITRVKHKTPTKKTSPWISIQCII